MSTTPQKPLRDLLLGAHDAIRARFSLREDRADDAEIDASLRAGVIMQGTNLWVLIFAIFIASIGLNVNSTAVVIGAMLISPLMGPIMGLGYGAGIHDFGLIRKALKNLGIATLIALLTSTAYFLITPLTTAQSELLARTTPTLWDVLIAVFGGLAGIVGVTRKQKSNVIPGVAIATALMPPLCTAGYGLATGAFVYFFGAFYLFTINCVFIATASALVTNAYHVQRKQYLDKKVEARVRFYLATVVVLTVLPSLYLAYQLVGDEIFRTRATQFVREQLEFDGTHITNINIDPKERRIEVSLIGEVVSKALLTDVVSRLPRAGIEKATLQVFQSDDQHLDVATLKSTLLGDLYRESQVALVEKDKAIQQLQSELALIKARDARLKDIPAEVHALYPTVQSVQLADAPDWDADSGVSEQSLLVANIRTSKPMSHDDQEKLQQWLRARIKNDRVRVVVERG